MNYISQVAKMLGVEIGERFTIAYNCSDSSILYYFDANGLHYDKDSEIDCDITLRELLVGIAKIKKLPWKPEVDETYYIPAFNHEGYLSFCWNNTGVEKQQHQYGLICKTREEAIEKTKKMLAAVKDE